MYKLCTVSAKNIYTVFLPYFAYWLAFSLPCIEMRPKNRENPTIWLVDTDVFCQYSFCHITNWRELSSFNDHAPHTQLYGLSVRIYVSYYVRFASITYFWYLVQQVHQNTSTVNWIERDEYFKLMMKQIIFSLFISSLSINLSSALLFSMDNFFSNWMEIGIGSDLWWCPDCVLP